MGCDYAFCPATKCVRMSRADTGRATIAAMIVRNERCPLPNATNTAHADVVALTGLRHVPNRRPIHHEIRRYQTTPRCSRAHAATQASLPCPKTMRPSIQYRF